MKLDGVDRSRGTYREKVRGSRSNKRSKKSAHKDRVEISGSARKAQRLNRAVEAVRKAPDVRVKEVNTAKRKLRAGEYDKPEITKKTAQRLERLLD